MSQKNAWDALEGAVRTIRIALNEVQGKRCCDAHDAGHTGADHGFIGSPAAYAQETADVVAYLLSLLAQSCTREEISELVRLYQEEAETWAEEEFHQFDAVVNHRGEP